MGCLGCRAWRGGQRGSSRRPLLPALPAEGWPVLPGALETACPSGAACGPSHLSLPGRPLLWPCFYSSQTASSGPPPPALSRCSLCTPSPPSAGRLLTFWACAPRPRAGRPFPSQPLCPEPQLLASVCLPVALTSASAGSWWSCGFCFPEVGTGPGIGTHAINTPPDREHPLPQLSHCLAPDPKVRVLSGHWASSGHSLGLQGKKSGLASRASTDPPQPSHVLGTLPVRPWASSDTPPLSLCTPIC